MYLICNNGYICWPTTICLYMQLESGGTRLKDLFYTNLESMRKEVECIFGILKSCWGSLDRGFKHWKVKVCGDIFRTFTVLHNMMLTEMVSEGRPLHLQQGHHLASHGGMWLEGPSKMPQPVLGKVDSGRLKAAFNHCWTLLAHHLRVWREINKWDKYSQQQ